MKKPRFSLRGLLVFTTLLAVFCYWRDRPRQNADRFIALIAAGDYGAAEAMFYERDGVSNPPSIFQDWMVTSDGQSASDWLRGRYPLKVRAMFGRRRPALPVTRIATEVIVGSRKSYLLDVEATATGVTSNESWKLAPAPSIWSKLRNLQW